jgi:hypothetical protein
MQCIVALRPQEVNEQKLGCIYPVHVAPGQWGTGAGAQQQAPMRRR